MKMYFDHQKLLLCTVYDMYKRRQMGTGLEQYKLYILGNFGKATGVFDGYSVTVYTKDSAHMG